MINRNWTGVILVAMFALLWSGSRAGASVELGQDAPEFSGLIGVDDRPHALADYEDAKLVVVVFTCNHCPVSQAYEDRLIALQKDYEDKEVQVIAINPNCPEREPEDSFEKMKERAAGRDLGDWRQNQAPFNFPYVVDATQEVAKAYGAAVTPHVFVLDGERRVAYMGSIDNNMNALAVRNHFVRDALDALLAGETPEPAATRPLGCTIIWK